MFQQHRFQLEGRDPVVTGLEHVVGPADVGQVALRVHRADIARVVVVVGHRCVGELRVTVVTGHQRQRPGRQVQADLALTRPAAICCHRGDGSGGRVDQRHGEPRHRPSHRAVLDRLAGGIADGQGHLGLTETVPDGQSPRPTHLFDDFRVQRLAGADHLARRSPQRRQVGLDQHPPDRRWGTEGADAVFVHHPHQLTGGEPLVVVDEHGRTGDPRREHVRPGVLRPPRRGDVQVDVAGSQAQPVDGGQVPDRIRDMAVLHEFGQCGGAGGEVQQQRVVGPGDCVGDEIPVRRCTVAVVGPTGPGTAHHDPGVVPRHRLELPGIRVPGDDERRLAAGDPITQIGRCQQRRGRDQYGTQLDRREDDLPQLELVAQHQDDPVTAPDADSPQPQRHLIRPGRQLRVADRHRRTVLLDDGQRGPVGMFSRQHVEPFQAEVERLRTRPTEIPHRGAVVARGGQEQVPGFAEQCCRRGRC